MLAAIKGLPASYPTILVTMLAFDPRSALADGAITIVPTLCYTEGLYTILRQVFGNAAMTVAGLVQAEALTP